MSLPAHLHPLTQGPNYSFFRVGEGLSGLVTLPPGQTECSSEVNDFVSDVGATQFKAKAIHTRRVLHVHMIVDLDDVLARLEIREKKSGKVALHIRKRVFSSTSDRLLLARKRIIFEGHFSGRRFPPLCEYDWRVPVRSRVMFFHRSYHSSGK